FVVQSYLLFYNSLFDLLIRFESLKLIIVSGLHFFRGFDCFAHTFVCFLCLFFNNLFFIFLHIDLSFYINKKATIRRQLLQTFFLQFFILLLCFLATKIIFINRVRCISETSYSI